MQLVGIKENSKIGKWGFCAKEQADNRKSKHIHRVTFAKKHRVLRDMLVFV